MDIVWLGHMSFHVQSGNTSLLMDPFSESIGLRVPPKIASAGIITRSTPASLIQENDTEQDAEGNTGTPTCLDGPGEYEVGGAYIKAIRVSAPAPDGDTPQWNTIFTLNLEGMSVCHLGNPSHMLTTRQIEDLGSPHILLVPVGSQEGLSVLQAVETINAISPRIIIPMMFAHPGNNAPVRELTPFLQEYGGSLTADGQPKLTITRNNLPEDPQLVLLKPTAPPI